MLGRVGSGESATDDGDGSAAGADRGSVRGAVDASGAAADDAEAAADAALLRLALGGSR